ncbi:MAG: hypothetical protein ACHP7N_13850 [Caulobacterales bacterium]
MNKIQHLLASAVSAIAAFAGGASMATPTSNGAAGASPTGSPTADPQTFKVSAAATNQIQGHTVSGGGPVKKPADRFSNVFEQGPKFGDSQHNKTKLQLEAHTKPPAGHAHGQHSKHQPKPKP